MFDLTRVNWSRLYYFYLVGQCRNITTAARYANIDQSGMSRHMMSLEKELGVELLLRSRDGIAFTEIGEKVFNNVSKMIELSKMTNEEVDSIRNDMTGSLKILTTQGVIRKYAEHLPTFYEKFPDIRLSFTVSRSLSETYNLEEHDIAILPKFEDNSEFEYVPIRKQKLAIFASKEYLEKYGIPKKPEDLDNHKLIAFSTHATPSLGFRDFHLNIGRKNKEMRQPYLQIGAADSMLFVCEKGMGIITYVDEKGVTIPANFVKILDEYQTEYLYINFIFKKKMKELRKIKEFISFFQKCL